MRALSVGFEKSNERPVHEVLVSGFYLDRYAVTNDEYREFVLANPE